MSRILVVCVRDRAVDAYGRPFFVSAIGQAVRSFSDEINRSASDNQLFNHPYDFDLYELGEFDEATGEFSCHVPRMVSVGKDLVKSIV